MFTGAESTKASVAESKVLSKDMTIEDLNEFSNVFASQFDNSEIHDRVLCFQIIEDEESNAEVDSRGNENESESNNNVQLALSSLREYEEKHEIGEKNNCKWYTCK